MKFQAVFSKTAADKVKSRLLSPQVSELTIDCYITPIQYGELMTKYFEKSFIVEIKEEEGVI